MAEEKTEEGEKEGGEAKPKKKGLPFLWIVVGLIAVLGVAGGAFFVRMKGAQETKSEDKKDGAKKGLSEEEHADADLAGADCPHLEEEGGHGAAKKGPTDTFSLDPFIVNLSGDSDVKFLKVTVKLKLAKAECTPVVEPHVAQMRDSILLLLSSKEYEMIKTVQGKMELRDEILERVKNIIKGEVVKEAFFTEFVAQ